MEPTSLPSTDEQDRKLDGKRKPLVERYLTTEGVSPYDEVEWERRDAVPGGSEDGRVCDLEVPKSWSQQALDIAAKLYLARSETYTEDGIRMLIHRVVKKITIEGMRSGYFDYLQFSAASLDDDVETEDGFSRRVLCEVQDFPARIFYEELSAICLQQLATFNSPVWFNIGREDRPQCPSACFILDVNDTTESIYDWYRDESKIFKAGSGSGVNLSDLRGSMETLSTGGIASGPVSFMRPSNAGAETIKSGGTTRRAAKIVQLDVDHPDIIDFIDAKVREEKHLRILGEAGVNVGFDMEGERNVAETTSFQSANNSVRVTDDFMFLATKSPGAKWTLVPRKNGHPTSVIASELLDKMAQATYVCADPGIMFHDTINSWHTTPSDSLVLCTNPCGELHTPNNSSCNLASVNSVKFLADDGIDIEKMRHVVDVMTLAMDILVDFCELPTRALTKRTKQYRWLGLGLSNMGAAIMSKGLPYDSDEARDFASSFMALETGRCYRMSARIAECMGAFHGFNDDRAIMLDVMDRHASHVDLQGGPIWQAADEDWIDARCFGQSYGYRNAQATVIAPAGTTSFFMDCDTTGCEPAFSLVTYKQLAGGGSMRLVNKSVERALQSLGYRKEVIESIETFLLERGHMPFGGPDVTAPDAMIATGHESVFHGANEISAEGHIKMIAALQPFISGAASKTINLPEDATVEDIKTCYVTAWEMGVKCISVYRNNSKVRQVLSSKPKKLPGMKRDESGACPLCGRFLRNAAHKEGCPGVEYADDVELMPQTPSRKRLPRTRRSVTHKIHVRSSLGEHEGYITAGMYEDGSLGEVFLEGFGRLGGFTQNVLSAWATSLSLSFQYGVPFDAMIRKHVGHTDETGGIVVPTKGERLVVTRCSSIVDYISCWLASEFGSVDLCEQLGVMTDAVKARKMDSMVELPSPEVTANSVMRTSSNGNGNGHGHSVEISAQECPECRGAMRRTGACLTCSVCYYNTGCG